MEAVTSCVVYSLNLPQDVAKYLQSLPGFSCQIKDFDAPELMVPYLKRADEAILVVVDEDRQNPRSAHEIERLASLMHDDSTLSLIPIIAYTADEKAQPLGGIYAKGYAAFAFSGTSKGKKGEVAQRIKNALAISAAQRASKKREIQRQNEDDILYEQLAINAMDTVGNYGRELLCARIAMVLNKNPAGHYVLALWDIDNFKVYNDRYGVEAGDELLRKIESEIAQMNLQEGIYAHVAADHFLLFMEERFFSGVSIQKYISERVSQMNPDFDFVVRLGVYRVTDANLHPALMMDRALMALRSIKGNYETRVGYYNFSMRGHLLEEQEIINDMEGSLANGEFSIYYQPQYNFATRTMSGAEALVRWRHPVKGMIPPDKFIPLFEQNGFITKLDKYIWEKVCTDIRSWIDEGIKPVPISVNISRKDICQPSLCSFLIALTHKFSIPTDLLRLEITESAYMEDPEQLIHVVQTLRRCGFCVEMDDFGSGYSSLNTLKDVPVDVLKLDMKFLISQAENTRSASILSSIVRMAKWLNLPVIAEGIENLEQAEFLKSIGCWNMQGYYFSRPVTESEFRKLLREADVPFALEEPSKVENAYNAMDFLSISTQNALLFNTFVGGAMIAEFTEGKVEAVRMNDKFFEVVGVPREEYMRQTLNLLDRFSVEGAIQYVNMLQEARDTGKEAVCEVLSKPFSEGGAPFWTRNRARYLASCGNSSIYYVATENVTNRMNLLVQNAYLAQELSSITENVPCGIMKVELSGGSAKLLFVNRYITSLFGYSEKEFSDLYRSDIYALYAKDDYDFAMRNLTRAIKKREDMATNNLSIIKKDGTKSLVYVEVRISYRENDVVQLNVIMLDLSLQLVSTMREIKLGLSSFYDLVLETDFIRNTSRVLSAKIDVDAKLFQVAPLRESVSAWIKSEVDEESRDLMFSSIDLAAVEKMQKSGVVPRFSFKHVLPDKSSEYGVIVMLQIDSGVYLTCCRYSKEG